MTFLEKLKKVCDDYDRVYGEYPETKFEGESIYEHAKRLEEIRKDKACHNTRLRHHKGRIVFNGG